MKNVFILNNQMLYFSRLCLQFNAIILLIFIKALYQNLKLCIFWNVFYPLPQSLELLGYKNECLYITFHTYNPTHIYTRNRSHYYMFLFQVRFFLYASRFKNIKFISILSVFTINFFVFPLCLHYLSLFKPLINTNENFYGTKIRLLKADLLYNNRSN